MAVRLEDGEVKFTDGKEFTSSTLTEKDIENVKNALPLQPWPQDVHKEVAAELSMTNSAVRRAIDKLISRGVVKDQVDGKLFDTVQ
jgi:predicted transcriptional regulator